MKSPPSKHPGRFDHGLAHRKETRATTRWCATKRNRVCILADRSDDLFSQSRLPDARVAEDDGASNRTSTDRAAERRPQLRHFILAADHRRIHGTRDARRTTNDFKDAPCQ
jgi:hypothetical protein